MRYLYTAAATLAAYGLLTGTDAPALIGMVGLSIATWVLYKQGYLPLSDGR